ncbi:MAG: hypothetical protein Q8S18_00035 [Bacteroidales bacterium]|nr:hypothetical protein [Bacteroidales bacterium]
MKNRKIVCIHRLIAGNPEPFVWVVTTNSADEIIKAPEGYPENVKPNDKVIIIKRIIIT